MPQNPASGAVMEALKRRGMTGESTPALNQVSQDASMANPMPSPAPLSEMTQSSAPQGSPTPQTPQAPKFQPQDRTDLITLALIEQMKNDNKLQKEQAKIGPISSSIPQGGGAKWVTQPMPINQQQQNQQNYSGLDNYGQGV